MFDSQFTRANQTALGLNKRTIKELTKKQSLTRIGIERTTNF